MDNRQAKILKQINDLLDATASKFSTNVDAASKRAYKHILDLIKDIDVSSAKRIKASVKNINLIAKIKKELEVAILDPQWEAAVTELTDSFEKITKLQNGYFSLISTTFSASKTFEALKNVAISNTIDGLLASGINANVTLGARDIISGMIINGARYADLVDSMRDYLIGNEETPGALSRYAKTYATDSLYGYSRQYTSLVSDDLGLVWYSYVGSLRETSRPFCKAMIESSDGCMEYFHKSQIPELLKGHICGGDVGLNKKTGLPAGMKPETNAANFIHLAGGWGCEHKIYAVSSVIVPQELRERFE